MKNEKRIVWFLSVFFLVSVFACTEGTSDTDDVSYDDRSILKDETFTLLFVADPFADAFTKIKGTLEEEVGCTINVEVVDYSATRARILQNAHDAVSGYDVVSFDVVWLGEFVASNAFLPLNDLVFSNAFVDKNDFVSIALKAGEQDGVYYGIPFQPHEELLWYRKDLFEKYNLQPPKTTDDVLKIAKFFHEQNEEGVSSIGWNAQRGQALGQTMAHMYAAFGERLFADDGTPTFDTERAVAAAKYIKELVQYSPSDILSMAWDQRVQRFTEGKLAMTYGWEARHYIAEESPLSVVKGKTGYVGAPAAEGVAAVTPFGEWSLAVPANIGERERVAKTFLGWITSKEVISKLAKHGSVGTPRYSVMRMTNLHGKHPTYPVVESLAKQDVLQYYMRPAIPEWAEICEILGTVYHDMLLDKLTPEEATAEAQKRISLLMEK